MLWERELFPLAEKDFRPWTFAVVIVVDPGFIIRGTWEMQIRDIE